MAKQGDLKNALTKPTPQSQSIMTVQKYLESKKDTIQKIIPKTMDAEKMANLVLVHMRQNPKLAKCSVESIIAATLQSCQLGLETTNLGYWYPVPYWNNNLRSLECQFQLGYQGCMELSLRSGEISTIHADIAKEQDLFDYEYGTKAFLKHKPFLGKNRGENIAAYMVCLMKDGSSYFHVMSIPEVLEIKERTKSRDKSGKIVGPWITDEDAMIKKTVIKQGCKFLPKSVEDLRRGLAADGKTTHDLQEDMALTAKDVTDWDNRPSAEPEIDIPEPKEVSEPETPEPPEPAKDEPPLEPPDEPKKETKEVEKPLDPPKEKAPEQANLIPDDSDTKQELEDAKTSINVVRTLKGLECAADTVFRRDWGKHTQELMELVEKKQNKIKASKRG